MGINAIPIKMKYIKRNKISKYVFYALDCIADFSSKLFVGSAVAIHLTNGVYIAVYIFCIVVLNAWVTWINTG